MQNGSKPKLANVFSTYNTLKLPFKVYALNITYQLTFLTRSTNFRRSFPQTKLGYGIYNLLPTYGRAFRLFPPLTYFQPASIFY